MIRKVRVALERPVAIGTVLTVIDPAVGEDEWKVIAWESDPQAVWEFQHYTEDEGGPEILPQTILVVMQKVE